MPTADLKLFIDWTLIALRVLGVFYMLGGVAAGWRSMAQPTTGPQQRQGSLAIPAPDADRQSWRLTTALLTVACGAAMVTADAAAGPMLGALLVQQSLYLIRQFMLERSLARPEQKARARVSSLTARAYVLTGVLAALAVFLLGAGALT